MTIINILFVIISYLFSAIIVIWLLIKTFFSSSKVLKTNLPIEEEAHTVFFENKELKIFSFFAGEIRMGPQYLNLKSEPLIKEIENNIFGDWFYKTERGVYLQKWNSTREANTDLIFVNFKTQEVQTIKSNISSVFFTIEKVEDELIFDDFTSAKISIS